jgi:hypothetical protein
MDEKALDCSRTLNAWLKADDKKLLGAIDAGLTIHEASEDLQREPMSVLRRISTIGAFEFENGSEEWVELLSLSLSGVPLQDVIAWCSASDDRLPLELLDAMRSGPDPRAGLELARELSIEVANVGALEDLAWLADQPEQIRLGYAAAALRVTERFDALTPATLKNEVLGIAPAQLRWTGGPVPKVSRAPKATSKARAPRRSSSSRGRKPKIRNRWAFANYMKKKRTSASGKH